MVKKGFAAPHYFANIKDEDTETSDQTSEGSTLPSKLHQNWQTLEAYLNTNLPILTDTGVLEIETTEGDFYCMQATDATDPEDKWCLAFIDDDFYIRFWDDSASAYTNRLRLTNEGDFVIWDESGAVRLDWQTDGDILINDGAAGAILRYDDTTDNRWEFQKAIDLSDIAAGAASVRALLGEGYTLYADNTGSGTDASRIWVDGPNQGEFVIGPRTGSDTFDRIRLRADDLLYEWEDADGDAASHVWPQGIIYDHGVVSETGETLGTWPVNFTNWKATANVPADISVTIFVASHIRFDNAGNQLFRALSCTIGGTRPINPALEELDLTTAGPSSSSTGGASSTAVSGNTAATSGHLHGAQGSLSLSHTHSMQSHTHSLSSQWNTLTYQAARSFVPTGSTVTIQMEGGVASGSSQLFDDGMFWYFVVIN